VSEITIDRHCWVLVDDEDPDETEICRRCGSQRNRHGRLTGKARITGGWPIPNCEDPDALTKLHSEIERLHTEKDEAQLQEHMAKNAEVRALAVLRELVTEFWEVQAEFERLKRTYEPPYVAHTSYALPEAIAALGITRTSPTQGPEADSEKTRDVQGES
jgi:hypothetical protein